MSRHNKVNGLGLKVVHCDELGTEGVCGMKGVDGMLCGMKV